ncbi:MAG: hypothetical protein QXU18_08020 [Thermoplasmatales archaeon]
MEIDRATVLKEILTLRNAGLGYKQIARRLRDEGIDLSPMTVRNYLREIQDKPPSVSAPAIDVQDVPVKNIEDTEGNDVESPGEKNIETLSNPEKITEKQDTIQSSKEHQRKMKRETVWLILSIIFFVSMMVFIAITILFGK